MTSEVRDMTTLAADWLALDEAEHKVKVEKHAVEQEMAKLMREDEAEVFSDGSIEATYKGGVEWDQATLDRLREFISPDDLPRYMTAERVIAPRWNATRVKPLAKQGGEVKAIIERAARATVPQLKVRKVAP